jgi:hypothetical protein
LEDESSGVGGHSDVEPIKGLASEFVRQPGKEPMSIEAGEVDAFEIGVACLTLAEQQLLLALDDLASLRDPLTPLQKAQLRAEVAELKKELDGLRNLVAMRKGAS